MSADIKIRSPFTLTLFSMGGAHMPPQSRYREVLQKSLNEAVLKLIDFYFFANRPRLKKTRALYVSRINFGGWFVVENLRLSFVVTS